MTILAFEEPAHKDLPDKVLDAFSSYLKPEMNVFSFMVYLREHLLPINSNHSLTFITIYNVLQRNVILAAMMKW